MRASPTRSLAALVAVVLALAACTTDDPNRSPSGPTDTPSPTIAPAAETPAAELRAAVGAGVQSHVYLLGVVTQTLLSDGSESPSVVRAQATLDENTAARFTDLWTAQIGHVVSYARGSDEGDEGLRTLAAQELDTFRVDLGTMFDELTQGVVPAEVAAAQVEPMFDGELAVVDTQAAGGDVTGELRETAGDAPPMADLIAGAIIVHEPDRYRDSVEAPAARFRSTMQALWQEHVYLTWYAADAGARAGFTSSTFTASRASLDANTAAMAELWGEDHGEDSGRAFRRAWDQEVEAMLAYAQGSATAVDELDGFRTSLARVVEEDTILLIDQEGFADELEVHVDSMVEAIDARGNDTRQQWALLFAAAGHMPVLADVPATATIQRYSDRYGTES